ncbi:MAG: hypothetical protein QXS48_03365 [Candidatus Aenigmatarchaeota archaeon]
MRKYKVAIVALLLFLVLSSSVALPTYASVSLLNTNLTIETSKTFEINGFKVYAKRFDIIKAGQHYVQIEVKTTVEGRVITIKSDPYPIAKIYPQPKPPRVPMPSWLFIEPGYRVMATTSSLSLPKYYWDGILFVRAPGSDYFWVKYDHPDNIETYYPLAKNKAYTLNGASKHHHHIPQYTLEDAKYKSTFASIAGLLGPIIAGLLAVPELVSKFVAGIIALVGAILALVGYLIRWFIENIIQTELGDGWIYTWGYGKLTFFGWVIAAWWWMSFGAWKDWGFFIII